MVPTLLAMLVGVGVCMLFARKFAERNPGWVGIAVFALACAAGVVALFMLAFATGYLLALFDVPLDTGAWLKGLARGIWGVFPGAAGGAVTADAEQARSRGQPGPATVDTRSDPIHASQLSIPQSPPDA